MKIIRILSIVGGTASLAMTAPAVIAQGVGTVLFAQEGAQITSASGAVRPARRGEVMQVGERLTTSANGISQVRLADGSLVGLRPGSQLRMDAPVPAAPSGQSLSLLQGGVRIIGAELMDRQRSSAVTLQTGQATLQLHGADLESMVLRAAGSGNSERDGRPEPRSAEAGSYNRLTVGSGQLRSGTASEPLVARQVSFVPAGSTAPMQLGSMPPASNREGGPISPVGAPPSGGAKPPLPAASPSAPPSAGPAGIPQLGPMTSTLTAPQPGPAGSMGGMPPPGGPAPTLSPIATGAFPGGPKGPAPPIPVMGPVGGVPGNMGPLGPPMNFRPPVICTPNPIPGKPPICK